MYLDQAKEVINIESLGLQTLKDSISTNFNDAIELILNCTHHIAISGMGKAGLIGNKISATFASTGTPSFFMHPAEAIHGDFGMLRKEDVVILMSYGGETEEIIRLIPMLKVMGNKIISITKSKTSTLGKKSDIVLEIGNVHEACPMGLAPTTSTTAMLVLGDALAIVLLKARNFDEKKFAFFHPGGSIGKKMLKVKEVMRFDDRCPILKENTLLKDVILNISKAQAGSAIIIDNEGKFKGIFTDGDLRRHLNNNSRVDVNVDDVMTKNPKFIKEEQYALEAVGILKENMIGDLPVLNDKNEPVGLIDLKDLVNIGLLDI